MRGALADANLQAMFYRFAEVGNFGWGKGIRNEVCYACLSHLSMHVNLF